MRRLEDVHLPNHRPVLPFSETQWPVPVLDQPVITGSITSFCKNITVLKIPVCSWFKPYLLQKIYLVITGETLDPGVIIFNYAITISNSFYIFGTVITILATMLSHF